MSRRLALALRPPSDGADIAMRAFAVALEPYLLAPQSEKRPGAALVDIAAHVPRSPRSSERSHTRFISDECRRGKVENAVKFRGRWLATEAAVDAWLRAGTPRLLADRDIEDDDLEPVLQSLMRPGRR